jgi:hypothetical protein
VRAKSNHEYASGETMAELAVEYEVGEATVWRSLRPFEVGAGEARG